MRLRAGVAFLALLSACATSAGVPSGFRGEDYLVRPLRSSDAELDYEAVMASREHLHERFGSEWPAADFSLEQNRADLARHERDFELGRAYTYTVMNPAEDRVLGCIYVVPSEERPESELSVLFWTRPSFAGDELERQLLEWLRTEWSFEELSVR